MRVIAGTARSMPLKCIEGLDTRPTTDRIKETLFNMLQPEIPGCRFLDLFGGSGAIGIEALSRGADYAAFAENRYVALTLRGMQAGVAAVIADVVCSLGHNVLKERSVVHICVMIAAFVAGFFLKINVVYLLLAAALIGVAMEFWKHRKGAKN